MWKCYTQMPFLLYDIQQRSKQLWISPPLSSCSLSLKECRGTRFKSALLNEKNSPHRSKMFFLFDAIPLANTIGAVCKRRPLEVRTSRKFTRMKSKRLLMNWHLIAGTFFSSLCFYKIKLCAGVAIRLLYFDVNTYWQC